MINNMNTSMQTILKELVMIYAIDKSYCKQFYFECIRYKYTRSII